MTEKTTINVHPKVFYAALAGIGLTTLGAVASYVTPEAFTSLGQWSAPAYMLGTVLVSAATGWLTKVEKEEEAPVDLSTVVEAPATVEAAAPAVDSETDLAAVAPTE